MCRYQCRAVSGCPACRRADRQRCEPGCVQGRVAECVPVTASGAFIKKGRAWCRRVCAQRGSQSRSDCRPGQEAPTRPDCRAAGLMTGPVRHAPEEMLKLPGRSCKRKSLPKSGRRVAKVLQQHRSRHENEFQKERQDTHPAFLLKKQSGAATRRLWSPEIQSL